MVRGRKRKKRGGGKGERGKKGIEGREVERMNFRVSKYGLKRVHHIKHALGSIP